MFSPGDRVWLLPDYDKREVRVETPAVVEKVFEGSGRVKVRYVEHKAKLTKSVEPKRLLPRKENSPELGEK
jgi:hypothetical protein